MCTPCVQYGTRVAPHSRWAVLHSGCIALLCLRAVMDVGMPADQRDAICAAYKAAIKQKLYDPGCYMASNESEYFAEGTQVCWVLQHRSA